MIRRRRLLVNWEQLGLTCWYLRIPTLSDRGFRSKTTTRSDVIRPVRRTDRKLGWIVRWGGRITSESLVGFIGIHKSDEGILIMLVWWKTEKPPISVLFSVFLLVHVRGLPRRGSFGRTLDPLIKNQRPSHQDLSGSYREYCA